MDGWIIDGWIIDGWIIDGWIIDGWIVGWRDRWMMCSLAKCDQSARLLINHQ